MLAFVPAKIIAVPLGLALAAGTAAAASYVAGSPGGPATASIAAPASQKTAQPCADQTWPYIERRCLTEAKQDAPVRLVVAPRASEAADYSAPAPDLAPKMMTSDGVLRGPGVADPRPVAAKPVARPRQVAHGSRRATQTYRVPVERSGRHATTPVIVIRPLRREAASGF
jgi:hypothetical protein